MPRAFDLRQPQLDHSPLANLLDFSNIDATVELAGSLIKGYLDGLLDGIVTLIKDLTGLDLSLLADALSAIDLSSPEAFFESLMNVLLSFGTILGIDSPLNALNLFNLVPPDLLGMLDVSHIGTTNTNLITDPDFHDATPIEGWPHDPTGGFGGTGARSVTADGTTKELLGNLIRVSAGQALPVKGKSKWTGLVGTGEPIAIGITGYSDSGGTAATVQATIASHNTTPPNTDWIDLTGNYTVPDNVLSLRTRLIVGSTATAGTVSFSKISATKVGPMLQRLIGGTNIGEFLPDDIEHLFNGIISNTLELLQKASQGDFDGLVAELAGDFEETVTGVGERLQTFLDSLSPLNGSNINSGSIIDAVIPGMGTLLDNIFGGLFGLSATNASHDDAASALQANAQQSTDHGAGIADMFARVSSLESKLTALGGTGAGTADGGALGVSDTDSFERVKADSLGPLWLTTYSGGAGVWATPNGHDAEFAAAGVTDRDFLCIRNNPDVLRSETDYQRVTSELSSKAGWFYDPLGILFSFTGHNDCWLRISDDTTSLANITGIRVRWGGDGSLSIVRFVAGAPTVLNAVGRGGIVPPGPGAALIGEAGILADGAVRTFRATIGAAIRLQVSETGTAPGVGAAFRRWGHGGRAEGHNLPLAAGQQIPGGMHFWNGMDQTLS